MANTGHHGPTFGKPESSCRVMSAHVGPAWGDITLCDGPSCPTMSGPVAQEPDMTGHHVEWYWTVCRGTRHHGTSCRPVLTTNTGLRWTAVCMRWRIKMFRKWRSQPFSAGSGGVHSRLSTAYDFWLSSNLWICQLIIFQHFPWTPGPDCRWL